MSHIDPYIAQAEHFSMTNAHRGLSAYPAGEICVITCLDPRTDPADFLEIELGDAAVIRNAGGRVTPSVIEDLALITYLADTKLKPGDEPLFEVAIIHHNKCGTSFLGDPGFRRAFAELAHLDEQHLIDEAVVTPADTVRIDVDLVLNSAIVSRRISVSGYVYDVDTGLLTTIVPTKPMPTRGSTSSEVPE